MDALVDVTDASAPEKLADLEARRRDAHHAGSEAAVARQHERGKLTARERVHALLDEGSFVELDLLTRHRASEVGLDQRPYTDGVITGWGTVEGRRVFLFSQDFTVFGGSLGEVFAEKVHKVMDMAVRVGAPFVGLNDGAGARIQEGVVSLVSYGGIFTRNVASSGQVPQISVIMGPCAGGAVYSPALTDFVFMVDGTSYMFVTGPDVVRTVTGEDVSLQELGGAATHATRSGVAHFVAPDDRACLAEVRRLLAFLPSNCCETPPRRLPEVGLGEGAAPPDPSAVVPDDPDQSYDMAEVLASVVDGGDLMVYSERWARNLLCAFARLDGHPVGVVANQPQVLGGVLDIDAAEKGARFVRTCDAFNIPVLTFVDVPGFLPGTDQEHGGIVRYGAKLLYAFCEATVPLVQVIVRKAYGGAYVAMASKALGADLSFAWPSARVAVMAPQGAVEVLHHRELEEAADPRQLHAELTTAYAATHATPYLAAERGYVDDVIPPAATRATLVEALAMLRSKRVGRSPRKHGNVPL